METMVQRADKSKQFKEQAAKQREKIKGLKHNDVAN